MKGAGPAAARIPRKLAVWVISRKHEHGLFWSAGNSLLWCWGVTVTLHIKLHILENGSFSVLYARFHSFKKL